MVVTVLGIAVVTVPMGCGGDCAMEWGRYRVKKSKVVVTVLKGFDCYMNVVSTMLFKGGCNCVMECDSYRVE